MIDQQLTREEAEGLLGEAAVEYFESQLDNRNKHDNLKVAIRRASTEAGMTQQQIADRTTLANAREEDGFAFRLSRQRISQILNEEE